MPEAGLELITRLPLSGMSPIRKIKPGRLEEAKNLARNDGLRNVFMSLGTDSYVVSGSNGAINLLKAGDSIKRGSELGTVSHVDTEPANRLATTVMAAGSLLSVATLAYARLVTNNMTTFLAVLCAASLTVGIVGGKLIEWIAAKPKPKQLEPVLE